MGVTVGAAVNWYSGGMNTSEWLKRVSMKELYGIPMCCGVLNVGVLLLPRITMRAQMSDVATGAASGVFVGVSYLCLAAGTLKTRAEVQSKRKGTVKRMNPEVGRSPLGLEASTAEPAV
jgi:hypothetical protein